MLSFSRSAKLFFKELSKKRYITYSVYELLDKDSDDFDNRRVHVGLRFDVDSNPNFCIPLAEELSSKKLKASFYFLTQPERYYDIWNSNVPNFIHEMGFEVGLHSNHYHEQLVSGMNGLKQIKQDVIRFSKKIDYNIRGITAHGHPGIERESQCIWDIYKNVDPQDLGVMYHDETIENMVILRSVVIIQDYLGVINAWRYYPSYPKTALRRVQLGSVVLFFIHSQNFLRSKPLRKKPDHLTLPRHIYNFIRIRLRHQIIGALIGEGQSARKELKSLFKL